jgi:hypothetical protein
MMECTHCFEPINQAYLAETTGEPFCGRECYELELVGEILRRTSLEPNKLTISQMEWILYQKVAS